jgi:uncharacterized SAM-binding protein YcdF (DUF218 family)
MITIMTMLKRQQPIAVPLRPTGRRPFRWMPLLLAILLVPPAIPHVLASRIPAPSSSRPADVVFVLSGGEGRIQAGYKAWISGAGKDLCILGAGKKVEPTHLLPEAAALPTGALKHIYVEGWSENTLENAFSAKSIVSERGYATVLLVTSNYHVPRAYLAFRKVLPPGVRLHVLPVASDSGSGVGFAWRWARRHFLEGWKYWGYRILLRWE